MSIIYKKMRLQIFLAKFNVATRAVRVGVRAENFGRDRAGSRYCKARISNVSEPETWFGTIRFRAASERNTGQYYLSLPFLSLYHYCIPILEKSIASDYWQTDSIEYSSVNWVSGSKTFGIPSLTEVSESRPNPTRFRPKFGVPIL